MSQRKSSNSSWQLRQHLKQYFVVVPPLMKTVSISRYTALCKILFNNAMEKYNKYDSSRDISACRSAYVDFYKFQIIALDRIPSHPDNKAMDPATKEWMNKSSNAAMEYLEDIVVRLDEDEDKNQLSQNEQALIDEFDGDPSTESVSTAVQSSSIIPILLDNNGLIQSDHHMTINNVQALTTSPETKAAVIDRNVFQNRMASLLVSPQGQNNNGVAVATMYDSAPSITYSSTPSLYNGGAALAVAVDDDMAISGLVGVFPSDIQIARLTLQYTKFSAPPPVTSTMLIQIGKTFGCNFYVYDYHVSFTGFLQHVPFELQFTRSAVETNRCFFLHLGIAVGIHPFILQIAFRYYAAKIMTSCEDWIRDIVSSVTEYAGFVDANALSFIWPLEFSGIRICIISGRLNSPIFSVFYQEPISPSDTYKDVYIRCDGNHFTLLRPVSNDGSLMNQLATAAESNGLVVQRHAISRSTELLSVNEAIKELLLLS